MTVTPYLDFGDRCEEALAFYKKAAGAQVSMMMRMNENPDPGMPTPPERGEKIMHSEFSIGGTKLMASDGMESHVSDFKGITLALTAPTDADTKRLFDALAAGGSVQMPLVKVFWTSSWGMLTDRFGVSWMVMTDMPQ